MLRGTCPADVERASGGSIIENLIFPLPASKELPIVPPGTLEDSFSRTTRTGNAEDSHGLIDDFRNEGTCERG